MRHPSEVTKDLEAGDVVLRRREELDLRLSRADRETDREAAFIVLARALRNIFAHNPEVADSLLEDAFPWLGFLPAKDRQRFVAEFTSMVVAAAELDVFGQLAQLIREWRATAEIHADPDLARRLQPPVHASGRRVSAPSVD